MNPTAASRNKTAAFAGTLALLLAAGTQAAFAEAAEIGRAHV